MLSRFHDGMECWASPYINHFVSADTIIPDQYNPQNLNRYSYVINNPLKYTDPTGHMQSCEDGDICRSPNTTSSATAGDGKHHRNHHEDDDPDPTNGIIIPTVPSTSPTTTPPTLTQTPASGGVNQYGCFTNPATCGTGTPTSPSSSTQSGSNGPNWKKLIGGTTLLLGLFVVDALLIAGVAANWEFLAPALPELSLTETGWVMVSTAVIVNVHITALNLIYEGFTGGEEQWIPNPIGP